MDEKKQMSTLRAVVIVSDIEIEEHLDPMMAHCRLPLTFQCHGHLSAESDVLNLCGLDEIEKAIFVTFVPKCMVTSMLWQMKEFLKTRERERIRDKIKNTIFTVPITGIQGNVLHSLQEHLKADYCTEGEKTMSTIPTISNEHQAYSVIFTAVEPGFSDEVISAARKAGASGGTVIHCRHCGDEPSVKFLGVSIQEEQEIVFTIAPNEQKTAIMNSIKEACGLATPAHGIVLSMPIDEMIEF